MTELKALEVLQLSASELQEITMIKLSRKLAKRKMEVEEKDIEELFEAFEYVKANYVANKSIKKSALPPNLFPTIRHKQGTTKQVGPILHLYVDDTPTDLSVQHSEDKGPIAIYMPNKISSRDTIVFVYDKQTYDSEVFVKNITQKEYRELQKQ